MPKVDYALLCDFARFDGGVCHIVAGGLDTVPLPSFPGGRNLGMALLLTFTRGECGRSHRVELIVQDEDGEQLARFTGTTTPQVPDDLPTGWPIRSGIALNFPVPFPREGLYSLELLVNDSNVKSFHLRAVAAPRQDA